jgi:HSP20 family molecular chaperone IbpA
MLSRPSTHEMLSRMDPSQNGGFSPAAGSSSYAPTVTQSSPVQSALFSYIATLSPLIQTIGQNFLTLSALLRPHVAATLNTAFEGVRTLFAAGCMVSNVTAPLPRCQQPPTDMYVDATGMVIVEVDLPGMAPDAVEVHLRDRTIAVTSATSGPRENVEYIRRRRLSGPLETVIKGIPAEVTVRVEPVHVLPRMSGFAHDQGRWTT